MAALPHRGREGPALGQGATKARERSHAPVVGAGRRSLRAVRYERRSTRESSGRRLVTRSASRCSSSAWANLREVCSSSRRRGQRDRAVGGDDGLDAGAHRARARRGGRTSRDPRARRARPRAGRRGRRRVEVGGVAAARGRRRAGAPRARGRSPRAARARRGRPAAAARAAARGSGSGSPRRRRSRRASTSAAPAVAARGGVEHDAAAEGVGRRDRAHDDAVAGARHAAGCSRRACHSPSPSVGQARGRLARAVVHVRAHPVRRVAQRRARSRGPATAPPRPAPATTSPRATSRRRRPRRG